MTYLEAFQITRDPQYAAVARGILGKQCAVLFSNVLRLACSRCMFGFHVSWSFSRVCSMQTTCRLRRCGTPRAVSTRPKTQVSLICAFLRLSRFGSVLLMWPGCWCADSWPPESRKIVEVQHKVSVPASAHHRLGWVRACSAAMLWIAQKLEGAFYVWEAAEIKAILKASQSVLIQFSSTRQSISWLAAVVSTPAGQGGSVQLRVRHSRQGQRAARSRPPP